MKKVLIAMPSLKSGDGIARVIMNYSDELKLNEYQIDYLVVNNDDINKLYYRQIIKNDSNIYVIPKNNKANRFFIVKKYINEILKKHDYDIIHVNLVDVYALAILDGIRSKKVTKIYHVHNPNSGITKTRRFIKQILNFLCKKKSDYFFSCSELAANSMLKGKKYEIVKNPIDVNKFKFDNDIRYKYRNHLNITNNEVLVGTVSRLEEQKNPFFTIDIINEMMKITNKIKFIYIGSGSLKKDIEAYIRKLNIEKNIILKDSSENIENYYMAMDIFLLPSKFEGLGIVYIEAQASGLYTYASDVVPQNTNVSKLISFLSLEQTAESWAREIVDNYKKISNREIYANKVIENGYDVGNKNKESLIYCYNKIMEEKK